MRWTTGRLRYLEDHANEGAKAIARKLGCSEKAVRMEAHRYGISLRRSWICPNCGHTTYKPLDPRTGWCVVCTKHLRAREMREQVAAMQEEARREAEADREKQRIYTQKWRAKKLGQKRNTD